MSKFKSFAQQGSFSDYQIQAPDETGKIEQETARTLRGKERAQRFLETNQAAFLQAKKEAQRIEAAQREENFNLQTQERQAYKDALDRDYQIRTQNDRSKAQADAANFRNIQQFSQTAAQLYGEYQKQDLKRNQEKNAALAYAAGADYKTVVAIQSLGDNLSKSEFAQTEFIRKKMEEGVSIDALFALYERRASKAFINNIGVAQNTAYAYEQAANLEIERFRREKPDATTEEQRRNLQIFEANYAASFVGVDGRGLNAELLNQYVYPIMRRTQTSFNSAFDKEIAKERKATIEQDMFKQLNYAWTTGRSTGVAQWLSTNASKAKFETFAKWVKNKSLDFTQTGLNSRDMDDLYDIGFSGVNGKPTTYGLSRGSLPDGAVFNEARNTRKRAEIQFTRAGREERENNAQAMAIDLYNQRAADGSISREDLAESQELDRKSGIPGFVSKGTEQMAKELDSVRYEAAYTQLFDDKLSKGTLTLQDLEQKGVSFALKQKYAPLVKQQNVLLQDKSYKDGVTTISNAITEYSLVAKGRIGNKDHYTTVLFKTDQLQQFQDDVLVKKIPIQDAVSGRLGIIAAKQAAPGAINQYGHYTEMVQSQAQGAVNYQEALQRDKDFIETSQTPNFRKDAAVAVNSYGQDNFYKDYYPMQRGEVTPQLKRRAAVMGVSPLAAINFLASGLGQPAVAMDTQMQAIADKITPVVGHLINTYRDSGSHLSRMDRADYIMSGGFAQTRGGFNAIQREGYDSFVKMAETSGAKFPELVAAQWALESAFGSAVSGQNNFFGAKATSAESSTAKQTKEFVNGQEISTAANFKNYSTPQAAVDELVNRWYKDYDRFSGVNNANSLEEAAMMLQQQGYATDPRYAEKLITIANSFRN